ncbi:MAG TPA: hypothetical protein ENJ30_05350 [Desulfobulbaceae bacterium]|nr:hypothetical protein [Desulfobulbaceae bacterium]
MDKNGTLDRIYNDGVSSDECKKSTYASMIVQLDKYWGKLFADPLQIANTDGTMYIQPQRTNNILERFFSWRKTAGPEEKRYVFFE